MNSNRNGRTGLRLISIFFAVMLMMLTVIVENPAKAEGYLDSEAQSMLSLINSFRTGSDAWYWNSDNTTFTTESGLRTLSYDSTLEEVAKTRAKELTQKFSHDRPDGSKWSTAFPDGNYYKGENISMGYPTAQAAFDGFAEANETYEGQGHRRNMLRREFTRVGLACYELNGVKYWVQEFASGSASNGSGSGNNSGSGNDSGSGSNNRGEWVKKGGKYYYKNADGSMATGWLKVDGKWYFLNKKGVMQTGWVKDGGKKYYMDNNGVMTTGWLKLKKKYYYFNNKGVMQKGWLEVDGNWYYFQSSGEMATGTVTIDGQKEVFSKKGVWKHSIIEDYDTPLGTNPMIQQIRKIVLFFQELLESLNLNLNIF